MAKKDSLYFKDFVSMIEISCRAAEHLQTSLKEFSPDQVQKRRSISGAIVAEKKGEMLYNKVRR